MSNAIRALLTLWLFLLLPVATRATEDVNRIVLQVNDQILTLHDYEARKAGEINALLADPRLGATERQEKIAEVGPQLMQQIFRELLLMSRARQLNLRVSEADVDAALLQVQERQGIKDRAELELALQAAGLTVETLRENLRREIAWSEVVGQEVTAKMTVDEQELRAYYRNHPDEFRIPEERHLEEVLVLDTSSLDAEARRELAHDIHRQLMAGTAFAEVVAPYQARGETTGVIDLGWLEAKELESSLADAAWALRPGEYTFPVLAKGGFHILRLVERKEAVMRPFNEVQPRLENLEKQRRFAKELRAYIAGLEANAYIRENLPPDAAGYRSLGDDYEATDELDLFRAPIAEPPAAAPAEGAASEAPTSATGES